MIRDMALNSQEDGIILTCGLDKMIKMTNITSNTLIHSFTCQHPIWSCAYNLDNPTYFYAGLGNGHVLTFDKRRTDKHIHVLNEETHNFSPVCSLQYVPKSSSSSFKYEINQFYLILWKCVFLLFARINYGKIKIIKNVLFIYYTILRFVLTGLSSKSKVVFHKLIKLSTATTVIDVDLY